jgi:hypothetical protein
MIERRAVDVLSVLASVRGGKFSTMSELLDVLRETPSFGTLNTDVTAWLAPARALQLGGEGRIELKRAGRGLKWRFRLRPAAPSTVTTGAKHDTTAAPRH